MGCCSAAQAPINARLGDSVGEIDAAFLNFVVGSVVLALAVVVGRSGTGLSALPGVPRRYLLGGLIGAAYVITAVTLVRTIGAGGIAAATITGQLVASVALDRAGALGLERRPLDADAIDGDRPARRRNLSGRRLTADAIRIGSGHGGQLALVDRLADDPGLADVQVVVERPAHEPLGAHRAQRRAEDPRWNPRHRPLHPQHPSYFHRWASLNVAYRVSAASRLERPSITERSSRPQATPK